MAHFRIEEKHRKLCEPHAARLWKLLNTAPEQAQVASEARTARAAEKKSGGQSLVTAELLAKQILPLCTDHTVQREMDKWIADIRRGAASAGVPSEEYGVKRRDFFARVHKSFFAPLLKTVNRLCDVEKLRSPFVDVISSAERRFRWAKIENRFANPDSAPSLRAVKGSKNFALNSDRGDLRVTAGTSDRDMWSSTNVTIPDAAKEELKRASTCSGSVIKIWSFDASVGRARVVTAYDAQVVTTSSCTSSKIVFLKDGGNAVEAFTSVPSRSRRSHRGPRRYNSLVWESNIHHEQGSKSHHQMGAPRGESRENQPRNLQRRSASVADMHAHENEGKSGPAVVASTHVARPASVLSKSRYPELSGMAVKFGSLWGNKVQDLAVSDTQAVVIVRGKMYTWGNDPCVLGHPPLPQQTSSMMAPSVADVIGGSIGSEEEFLHSQSFINAKANFEAFHIRACRSACKPSNDKGSLWLEYPHEVEDLWKVLQVEWQRYLCNAGPRRLKSADRLDFAKVTCGDGHALAITTKGRLFAWGRNTHYCLGLGEKLQDGEPYLRC